MLTPHEKLSLIESLKRAIETTEKLPTTTPCYDCSFWQAGHCLKWKEAVPKDAVADGCDQFIFNPLSPPF